MSLGATAPMKQAVMKQEAFIARHDAEWTEFEAWLVARGDNPREARSKQSQWQGLPDEDVPARYRRLCQQLALARSAAACWRRCCCSWCRWPVRSWRCSSRRS